jgi:hypothetical protein
MVRSMYIGPSLFLIAAGAILKFAVTETIAGIDIQTAGVILMVVGALGLLFSLVQMFAAGNGRGPDDPRTRDFR